VCPATAAEGIEGKVVLRVRVRADGTTDRVKVIRGIGHGCDEVAVEALRRARFEPALDATGQPTHHEIRYNYIFVAAE
jgi:TonB family protein